MNPSRRRKPRGYIGRLFDTGVFPIVIRHVREVAVTRCAPHYHLAEAEIQVIHAGCGAYFVKDRRYAIKERSILLIHPRETHHFALTSPPSLLDRTTVMFNPKILRTRLPLINRQIDSLLKCAPHFKHHLVFGEKEFTRVNILLKDMQRENQGNELLWQDVVLGDLLALLALHVRTARKRKRLKFMKAHPLVTKAMAYIKDHYAEKVLLFEVSKAIACSAFHLCHIFKQSTGLNFKEYLTVYRVHESKRLLEEGDLKITAIGSQVGFADFQTFNRSFKKVVGFTPSTYRKFHRP